MTEHSTSIKIETVLPMLPTPWIYTPEIVGLSGIHGTGKNTSICIIDSGLPDHDSISNIAAYENFTNSPNSRDLIGHSTMVAGIIGANTPSQLVGIAPDSQLYFAKAIGDSGNVRFDSFVAAVLWAVIKEVDIIVIPLTTDLDNPALKSVIDKAYKNNICIIASTGNNKVIEYPATYDTVLSVGSLSNDKEQSNFSASGNINVIAENLPTCYIEQTYCIVSGTSIAAAIGGGIAARIIEKLKADNTKYTSSTIQNAIKKLCI